jgi:hypothetical protein
MKKVGLDFHGVLDKHTEFFSDLTKLLVANLWQVHIITGAKLTTDFIARLDSLGIDYTHLFSIVDYHESIGTQVNYDSSGPWIDTELWNKTKAEYCEKNGIDMHIDDSDVYGKYFKDTMFLQLLKPERSHD